MLGLVKCTLYTSAKNCGMNVGNLESKELCGASIFLLYFFEFFRFASSIISARLYLLDVVNAIHSLLKEEKRVSYINYHLYLCVTSKGNNN